MRGMSFFVVFYFSLAGSVAAQTAVSGMDDLPPLHLTPVDHPTFSNGTPVSQPLKAPLPEPALAPVRETSILSTSSGPIPKSWYTAEFLMLWPQGQRVPGNLTSETEHAINTGGRFVVGWSFGQTQQAGMEVSYLFAGSRTSHSGTQYPRYTNSYCDVSGFSCGTSAYNPASFKTTTRNWLQSWGATGLFNLFAGDNFRVHALVGYRNFLLNETFRGETSSAYQGFDSSYKSLYTNQIDRNTRFHGGELGLRSELIRGAFSLELETKVALGNSYKSARYRNQTVSNYDGLNGPFVQYYPNDPERITQSHFAVLPEGSFKLGYQLGDRARVSVGYTVIYMSDAKLKDENDLSYYSIRNDYLIQGLTMGLEWRY
jgi:Putative beta barrel porin-7 (BBP7)